MVVAGILLIAGSLTFLGFAYGPLAVSLLTAKDAETQAALTADRAKRWHKDSMRFGLGAFGAAIGMVLVALIAVLDTRHAAMQWPSALSALLAILGFSQWLQLARRRLVLPPDHAAATAGKERNFTIYVLLTQAALVALGVALLNGGYLAFAGWTLIGVSLASAVGFYILKDSPPAIPPALLLIAGVALVLGTAA